MTAVELARPQNRASDKKENAMQIATRVLIVAISFGAALWNGVARSADHSHHTVVPADEVSWGPAPPSLPPGAQAAALLGSPAKDGPFVLRLRFPAGFVVPPHRHSKDEFVTVISGGFAVAAGEKLNRNAAKPLPAGSFVHLPSGMPHYAWVETETVVQINGVGPFDVNYIDPKDDPRTK
jgi:quercetin dioxygenase-like cupin family protein